MESSTYGWSRSAAEIRRRAGDDDRVSSYDLLVGEVSAMPTVAEPELARAGPQLPYRWMRPLTIVAIGFVVTTAFQTRPAPGAHGESLAVTTVLIGIAGGLVAVLRCTRATTTAQMLLFGVVVLCSAVLVELQPNGPGFLAVFPAVCAAALRLPVRSSSAVAATAVAALAVGWTLGGHHPVAGIVLNEFGVVAFFLIAVFARRLRESNEHTTQLLTELEQTRAAQAQAAALGERQRLAREMHDVLAHSLSGLVLNLESARLLAARSSADTEIGDAIERAHRLAKTGLEEARRAIGMLRDDELPGPERLTGLATGFAADTGVPCTVTVTGDQHGLDTDGRLTLYRVAQEALTNIRKHARPDRVELCLAYQQSGTRLSIEDFAGNGDRPPRGDGSGYGLTGMRERAELLGGTLTAGPTVRGYRVELWVPA